MSKKEKTLRTVYVIGDRCESYALLDGDYHSYGIDAASAYYYQHNSSWDNLPRKIKVKSRVSLLGQALESMSKAHNVQYRVQRLGKNVPWKKGEISRWSSISSDSVRCQSIICRYDSNNPVRTQWNSVLRNATKKAAPNNTYVIAMYCVTGEADDYGLEKHRGFYERSGSIVLRSTAVQLFKRGSFLYKLATKKRNESLANKTTLILTVDSLRRIGMNIRMGLSWEQLVRETIAGLRSNNHFTHFACVVVTYRHEGCLLWYPSEHCFEFVYAPSEFEDAYVKSMDGTPFGTSALFEAEFVDHLVRNGTLARRSGLSMSHEEATAAAKAGLSLIRGMMVIGFEFRGKVIKFSSGQYARWKRQVPKPLQIRGIDECAFSPDTILDGCSILDLQLSRQDELRAAKKIVKKGKAGFDKIITTAPFFHVGDLITYDCDEIEQFNNLRNLLSGYATKSNQTTPLPICVFGNPGAGKSFAVKQIAASIDSSLFNECLEFNLSQMISRDDLLSAFRQITDASLRGRIPLVFFDEFDAAFGNVGRFGWLQNFLAPIQDGLYVDKGRRYAFGRSVFVFAGGTCRTHSEFSREVRNAPAAKGKDFLSRVKGYVDIRGINPAEYNAPIPYIKRAVLLRSLILRRISAPVDYEIPIEDAVLNAFLKTPEYYHDARSMDAIISTSSLAQGVRFTPSCIENSCLDLHVPPTFSELLHTRS